MVQSHIINNDDETVKVLAPYIQSGNLNFLIGSGASLPAIKTAGDIEKKLDKLIKDGKTAEADCEMIDFIETIGKTYKQLNEEVVYPADLDETLNNYRRFISTIDQILFYRKNEILPRQATIFSTNYDMFVEFAGAIYLVSLSMMVSTDLPDSLRILRSRRKNISTEPIGQAHSMLDGSRSRPLTSLSLMGR